MEVGKTRYHRVELGLDHPREDIGLTIFGSSLTHTLAGRVKSSFLIFIVFTSFRLGFSRLGQVIDWKS